MTSVVIRNRAMPCTRLAQHSGSNAAAPRHGCPRKPVRVRESDRQIAENGNNRTIGMVQPQTDSGQQRDVIVCLTS